MMKLNVHHPSPHHNMRRPHPELMQLVAAATCSFFLLVPTTHGDTTAAGAACRPEERDALLAFKHGVAGDPAGRLATWHGEGEDCCRWKGVRCSDQTGHVIELHLGNGNYDIYSDTALVGQISPSLLVLERLRRLNLSHNNLNGSTSRVPEFLGSLRNLNYLNHSGISFYGNVPPHLGNLTALQYLDLSGIEAAYSTDLSWLLHLRSLQYLNLDSVNLSAVADWIHVVNTLPSLRFLHLSSCSLSGMLPELLRQLTGLVSLDLSLNVYTGPFPEFIGNLTSLWTLDLSWNKLTGPIPASISYITGLRTLDLSYNNLTGLPHEIGTLGNLTDLYVTHNHLDSVITEEIFRNLNSLQHIDLSSNFLKIEISSKWQPPFRLRNANFATCKMGPLFPAWLQWMVGIYYLDVSSMGINDMIPDWLPSVFSNARYLSMSKNQLIGGLPANIEIMSSLEQLDLSNNQLSGQIPKLPHNLIYLDIFINSLSGSLPANIGLPNLQVLSVASNRITGHIPGSICKSEGLRTLVLANNRFEGELPKCFGNRVMLFLDLSNNNISGMLPSSMQNSEMLSFGFIRKYVLWKTARLDWKVKEVTVSMASSKYVHWEHCYKAFQSCMPSILGYIRQQYISISGSLPKDLSNLKSLKREYPTEICSDVFHVKVFATNFSTFLKGQKLLFGSIPAIVGLNMKIVDLSFNDTTGEIPEEISNLDRLLNLNLSRNHFSGNMPRKIGAMKSLESLDLSSNKLSGEIPAILSNLTFLSYLDLSYNNLTRTIPSGLQIDTLYAEHPYMYNGNIGI